jgi:hypothetical protein
VVGEPHKRKRSAKTSRGELYVRGGWHVRTSTLLAYQHLDLAPSDAGEACVLFWRFHGCAEQLDQLWQHALVVEGRKRRVESLAWVAEEGESAPAVGQSRWEWVVMIQCSRLIQRCGRARSVARFYSAHMRVSG